VTLTSFGNHILHHLFPTLDHALLPQLEETLIETCKEFEVEIRKMPIWNILVGQFQQLARTKPNLEAVKKSC
jgi:fatty acid desaturase